jgi:hypothetical protein
MGRAPQMSPLHSVLNGLHESLHHLFKRRLVAQARRRGVLQRQLLTGLELLCKVEDQVVLPALYASPTVTSAIGVRRAIDELNLLRDMALLTTQIKGVNREASVALLERMTLLHVARVRQLLEEAPANALNGNALAREVSDLLSRWRSEIRRRGAIEDEDLDPVGLPPR